MDDMHCFTDSTSILVKIKSVSLYNCRIVYKLFVALVLFQLWLEGEGNGLDVGLYNAMNLREIHKRKAPLWRHSSWHRWDENTKTNFKRDGESGCTGSTGE